MELHLPFSHLPTSYARFGKNGLSDEPNLSKFANVLRHMAAGIPRATDTWSRIFSCVKDKQATFAVGLKPYDSDKQKISVNTQTHVIFGVI